MRYLPGLHRSHVGCLNVNIMIILLLMYLHCILRTIKTVIFTLLVLSAGEIFITYINNDNPWNCLSQEFIQLNHQSAVYNFTLIRQSITQEPWRRYRKHSFAPTKKCQIASYVRKKLIKIGVVFLFQTITIYFMSAKKKNIVFPLLL